MTTGPIVKLQPGVAQLIATLEKERSDIAEEIRLLEGMSKGRVNAYIKAETYILGSLHRTFSLESTDAAFELIKGALIGQRQFRYDAAGERLNELGVEIG